VFDDGRSEISLVVIDDQDVVHAGIEAWVIGCHPRVKIVAHYTSPADFHRLQAATPTVDVVLFELQYKGRKPDFQALRELCHLDNRVVVYSNLLADEIILRSLDAGAVTYVAKSESGQHLAEAIYAARTAKPYTAPHMAQALINDKTHGRPRLSKREQEVLMAWCQTENKDLVGKRLFIEPSTVRTHLQRVRAKYAAVGRPASTKAALIARAIQDGLIDVYDF
jgi:DNA-binding NarL/FixJ family response regulator